MEKFVGKTAIVTGTSSGSGEAIAKQLLRYGINVVGLARRVDKLEELKQELANSSEYKGKFYPLQCDVSKRDEVISAFNYAFENVGQIHILVNNAAVMHNVYITDAEMEMVDGLFDVNVKSVILCSTLAVKHMAAHKIAGHIININSVLGQVASFIKPNVYMLFSSTKHALRVISEGLRREMIEKKLDIKVTDLSPAFVNTEMTKNLNVPEEFKKRALRPEHVAKACISCLNTPPRVVINELVLLPLNMRY